MRPTIICKNTPDEKVQYLFILSYGKASLLEIESVIDFKHLDARVENADLSVALMNTSASNAKKIIQSLGGSYKVARVLGSSLSEALENADLPPTPKFNWTVAAYECSDESFSLARQEFHGLLKKQGVGKSKFLEPNIVSVMKDKEWIRAMELKVSEVNHRILSKDIDNQGVEFIVHGGFERNKPFYAQTILTLDTSSFDKRDFQRPFQDPTKTVSPRLSRLLVNLALKPGAHSILDPFCGLGTVLQEALLAGVSVIGTDKSQMLVDQTKSNIEWLKSQYIIPPRSQINLFAYDARRISHARIPRVDSIASEPILLPVFNSNPARSDAKRSIDRVSKVYERCIKEFGIILSEREDRVAIITPVIIDASGRQRSFDLSEVAHDAGFRPYQGSVSFGEGISYPFRIESSKRKMIQRNLNVYLLS